MNWNKFDESDPATYPTDGGTYLVSFGENYQIVGFFKDCFRYSAIGSTLSSVDYWMELPKPPTELHPTP
jgi:hypothetical protein